MTSTVWIKRLSLASMLLAFCVILLGVYTRLSDAGLGCPDWPGCYGQLTAPRTNSEITAANLAYPDAPVDAHKAQIEMTHRYFAQMLGGCIFLLAIIAFIQKRHLPWPVWLPVGLLLLVVFQGLLGMWTVTLKLLPIVVVGHLIGGLSTLSLLCLVWLSLRIPKLPSLFFSNNLTKLALITLLVLIGQILLGGWTSANFAALICPDFPLCQGQWLPHLHLSAFNVLQPIMDSPEKTTIHFSHRLGAFITLTLGMALSFHLWQQSKHITVAKIRKLFIGLSHLLAILLFVQAILGISNVLLHLPLSIAVTHHAIAALLLLTLITINYLLRKANQHGEI